jgi:hypothetical protein
MPFLFWLPMILMGGMFMVAANGGAQPAPDRADSPPVPH